MEKKKAFRVILLSILVSYTVCEGKIHLYSNYFKISRLERGLFRSLSSTSLAHIPSTDVHLQFDEFVW